MALNYIFKANYCVMFYFQSTTNICTLYRRVPSGRSLCAFSIIKVMICASDSVLDDVQATLIVRACPCYILPLVLQVGHIDQFHGGVGHRGQLGVRITLVAHQTHIEDAIIAAATLHSLLLLHDNSLR